MAHYVKKGFSIDYKNTGETIIAAGDIVNLTTRIGVATSDIPIGAVGSVAVAGVFSIEKTEVAVAPGAALYYDAAAGKLTTTADKNVPAGWAVAASQADDAVALVKIG